MALIDVVSSATSPRVDLMHGLTGLRLTQAQGGATVETGRYHIDVDGQGVRVQDTHTQAWLDANDLPPGLDPVTLVLTDGTKLTLAWVHTASGRDVDTPPSEPEPRLGSVTITRGDETVTVRLLAEPSEGVTTPVEGRKHQGLASLWADASQPDGRVLHTPTEAGADAAGEPVPVLRWVPGMLGAGLAAPVLDEAGQLRQDLHALIRHALAAGRIHAPREEAQDDEGDQDAVTRSRLQQQMAERAEAEARANESQRKDDAAAVLHGF